MSVTVFMNVLDFVGLAKKLSADRYYARNNLKLLAQ